MGTRSTTVMSRAAGAAAAAAIATLLLAATAAAATRTVEDPKFDTPYLSGHGRLDITRATAGRSGLEATHAVRMRARVKPARPAERPSILINTRGGKRSGYEFIVFGNTVFRVPKQGRPQPIGAATLTAKGRTWRYGFDLGEVTQIGAGYGWAAATEKPDNRFADVAPGSGYAQAP